MKFTSIIPLLALLAIPNCANLAQRAQDDGTHVASAIPKFPIAVPSTEGPVPVLLVRHLQQCGPLKADATHIWFGCYHYGPPRYIEIEDTLPLLVKWRTLHHEMVHLALAIDHATLSDMDDENRVAEAIAKQRAHAQQMGWPRR
jgi:hypothetical protein